MSTQRFAEFSRPNERRVQLVIVIGSLIAAIVVVSLFIFSGTTTGALIH